MRLYLMCLFIVAVSACAQSGEPLRLAGTVALPGVEGRIDHLSIDVKGQRLFVAALGNNTIEVIDVKSGKHVHSIHGLHEPQGLVYVPSTGRLYAANGGDGSLCVFDGSSYRLLQTIPWGADADNLRYDPAQDRIYLGYGSGAIGVADRDGTKLGEIRLDAHPESFQLEAMGSRIFVNLPGSRKIAVADRESRKVIASWTTGGPQANYPMALDEADHRLFVVCRDPARIVVLDTLTGRVIETVAAVGDCDDVFYDTARKRIYAIGGEGAVSIYQQLSADHYSELARIPTSRGARTGLFSPDLRRLFIAARREGTRPAEIRIYDVQ